MSGVIEVFVVTGINVDGCVEVCVEPNQEKAEKIALFFAAHGIKDVKIARKQLHGVE